jgi:hypothetical protein
VAACTALSGPVKIAGGQVAGNNRAETRAASLRSVYRLNDPPEDPELLPNLSLGGSAAAGALVSLR